MLLKRSLLRRTLELESCMQLLYTPSCCCSRRKLLSYWSSDAFLMCCEVHFIVVSPILWEKNPLMVQPNREEALPLVLLLVVCRKGNVGPPLPPFFAACWLLTKDYYWRTPILVVQLWKEQKRRSSPLSNFLLRRPPRPLLWELEVPSISSRQNMLWQRQKRQNHVLEEKNSARNHFPTSFSPNWSHLQPSDYHE